MEKNKEKRLCFRVDLLKEVQAVAKISSINDKKIEVEKTIPVSLLDLSASGMRVRMSYNLPINVIILNVTFEFENERFEIRTQVIRKMPKGQEYEYGLKFLSSQDQARIMRCLNMYKIKNIKFKKVELDLRVQKYIGCFVKFLELIEEPAYLITDYRVVVASNLKAQQKGVRLGERCYNTICKQHNICSHCKLETAIKKDQVIETEAFILGQECTARWLYTEDGLIIHYFKNNS
jgi:hypothetical protein